MAAKVIDALVVTLGLDASKLKSQSQDAQKSQKDLKDNVKKSSNEITDSLMDVTRGIGVMLLGFEGIKGAISSFAGLNVELAGLGRFSKNLGQSVHEINAWDQAIELAGGSAQDAQADLQGLSASITQLNTTGTVSPLLQLFSRLGISLYDSQGRVKKLTDLYTEMGDKLQQFNRADAFNLARQAGLSESTFNFIEMQADKRAELLATAEANNKADEKSAQQAAELQKQWREIGQEIKAIETEILTGIAPAIQKMFKGMKEFIADLRTVADLFKPVVEAIKTASESLDKFLNKHPYLKTAKEYTSSAIESVTNPISTLSKLIHGVAEAKRAEDAKKSNNNPGNIRYAGQKSAIGKDDKGFAIFPDLATGIREANRQLDLYAQRGVNTISSIVNAWAPAADKNNVPAYISDLVKRVGKGADEQLSAADRQKLLQAIFNHEGSIAVPAAQISSTLGANHSILSASSLQNQAQSPGAAGNTSNASTNVQIDNITVQTQATDAHGIAAELPPALRRKGVVAQANTGQS